MRKRALLFLCLFILCLTVGCSSKDRGELLGWLKNQNAENMAVTVWTDDDFENELVLTAEETKTFFTILHSLEEADLTWNKHLAGITPEQGFHLIADNKDFYINQAGSPHGQFEISYQHKLWWIESGDLLELLTAIMQSYGEDYD